MTFYYAQIADGRVVSVLESSKEMEDKPDHVIQIDGLNINLVNKLYVDGEFIDLPPPPKTYTRVQLIDQLGDSYVSVVSGAKTDVETEVWLEKFRLTDFFDFANQNTVNNMQLLVTKGYITQSRLDEIMAP